MLNVTMQDEQKDEPIKSFEAIIINGKGMISMSYGSDTQIDEEGNGATIFLHIGGDWKLNYKNKEYIIPMSENINALIDWINENE